MRLVRFVATALSLQCAGLVFAQEAPVAPMSAEETALRERVQQFYQLQLDKKFRQAEAYVAEASKDDYYNSNKGNFTAFRITAVEFLEPGKVAKVTVKAKISVVMIGANGPMSMEMPYTNKWIVEDGKWVLKIEIPEFIDTPFGKFKAKPGTDTSSGAPGGMPGMPKIPPVSDFKKMVQADKASVTLTAAAPEDTVTVKNNMPGVVDLRIESIPGIDAQADKLHLNAGESALVRIRRAPGTSNDTKSSGTLRIIAAPLQIVMEVQVAAQ